MIIFKWANFKYNEFIALGIKVKKYKATPSFVMDLIGTLMIMQLCIMADQKFACLIWALLLVDSAVQNSIIYFGIRSINKTQKEDIE